METTRLLHVGSLVLLNVSMIIAISLLVAANIVWLLGRTGDKGRRERREILRRRIEFAMVAFACIGIVAFLVHSFLLSIFM